MDVWSLIWLSQIWLTEQFRSSMTQRMLYRWHRLPGLFREKIGHEYLVIAKRPIIEVVSLLRWSAQQVEHCALSHVSFYSSRGISRYIRSSRTLLVLPFLSSLTVQFIYFTHFFYWFWAYAIAIHYMSTKEAGMGNDCSTKAVGNNSQGLSAYIYNGSKRYRWYTLHWFFVAYVSNRCNEIFIYLEVRFTTSTSSLHYFIRRSDQSPTSFVLF